VKTGDDLMAATRYGLMMLRYARTNIPSKPRRMPRYARFGGWMSA
jgi:hypothetical protein